MKMKLLIGMICVFFVWLHPTIRCTAAPAQDSCAIIRQAIDDTLQIKPGMTRADVEKKYQLDGGLQPLNLPSTTRYLYLKCSLIKIDVEFKAGADSKRGSLSPNDIVVSVSKPYLEYPFTD